MHAPLAIFCSPFFRCVQTADAIASELEGLQREGLHAASATKICIEPGLAEDTTFAGYKERAAEEAAAAAPGYAPTKSREAKLGLLESADNPWTLNPADLMVASPRIDTAYAPLRAARREASTAESVARYHAVALELSSHPLVRDGGTALLVTHGRPSTHMVRALAPSPGGIFLPDYQDIKAGNYDGPPLQYTATTALRRDHAAGTWDLAPGFKLFSNEHDPRLKEVFGTALYPAGHTNKTTARFCLKGEPEIHLLLHCCILHQTPKGAAGQEAPGHALRLPRGRRRGLGGAHGRLLRARRRPRGRRGGRARAHRHPGRRCRGDSAPRRVQDGGPPLRPRAAGRHIHHRGEGSGGGGGRRGGTPGGVGEMEQYRSIRCDRARSVEQGNNASRVGGVPRSPPPLRAHTAPTSGGQEQLVLKGTKKAR